ncbi:hypothetical protein [Bradyrhizobium zhanjiangense]|nr:hypothetical protein [Bradyrhizobium zhanjiangense]
MEYFSTPVSLLRMTIADMRADPAQMTAMITITITVGGIIQPNCAV